MAVYREQFGEKVKEILLRHGKGGKPLSTRSASRMTQGKVSHQSIADWSNNNVVPQSLQLIRDFADCLGEPRTPLIAATGGVHEPTRTDEEWDREHYGYASGEKPPTVEEIGERLVQLLMRELGLTEEEAREGLALSEIVINEDGTGYIVPKQGQSERGITESGS